MYEQVPEHTAVIPYIFINVCGVEEAVNISYTLTGLNNILVEYLLALTNLT